VILLIVILAVVNLVIGVAAALAHDRLMSPRMALATAEPEIVDMPIDGTVPLTLDMPQQSPRPPGEMPEHWREMMAAFSLQDLGIVEAAEWICVRQCEDVRQQLTRVDSLHRALRGDDALPPHELDKITHACHRWFSDLHEAIRQLRDHDATTDPSAPPVDEMMYDYASQIESDLAAFEHRETPGAAWTTGRRQEALQRLLDTAYRLRDELYEHLALELQARGRIIEIAAHLRVDPEMAVYNRIGLEYLMADYQQKYDASRGATSVALIDVDRFRRIQQELGAAQSDALLAVFGEMAERTLRHSRGFDHAARIGGHSFVFFLGYTPLSGAAIVCERLRQQVEAASFVVDGRELELTVSCSAVELQEGESLPQALKRLRAGLQEARKAGRNRTCVDDGQQHTIVQPKQLQVTGQTIEVPSPSVV